MRTSVPIVIFALVVILFFYDVIIGPNVFLDANPFHFDPWRSYASEGDRAQKTYRTDSFVTYLPRRVELTESLRSGRFPLWNPYIFCGMPFFADPQTRVLYPIALLLTFADPLRSMGYDVAIHLFVAMVGMYLFLRVIRVNTLGAMGAAFAYAFSSFFYVRMGHPTFVATGAWIPFFFYAYEKARLSEWVGALLLTIFFVMGYLAGFPQVFLFGVGAVIIYGLYVSLYDPGKRIHNVLRACRVFAIAGVLSMLVVAVQLVPFAELVRNSVGLRYEFSHVREIFLTPPIVMLRSIIPNLFGNPVEGTDWSDLPRQTIHTYRPDFAVYCGIGALVLAVGSLFFIKKSPRIRILLFLLLMSIGMAVNPFLLRIGYTLLPVFRASRVSRVAVVACFAVAAMAGLGFSYIHNRRDHRLRKYLYVAVAAMVASVLLTGIIFELVGDMAMEKMAEQAGSIRENLWKKIPVYTRSGMIKEWAEGDISAWVAYEKRQIRRAMVLVVLSSALVLLMVRPKAGGARVKTVVGTLLVTFILIDVGITAKGFYISQVPDCLFETRGIRIMSDGLRSGHGWRTTSTQHTDENVLVIPPNTNRLYQLPAIKGQSTIIPKSYDDLIRAYKITTVPARLQGREGPLQLALVKVCDLSCVRYLLLSKYKTLYLSSQVFRSVGSNEDLASKLKMLTLGGDTRLTFCQPPNEALNIRTDIPSVDLLDFAIGFTSDRRARGDTINFILTCGEAPNAVGFEKSFDLYSDKDKWHEFRIDISTLSGSRARLRMGWIPSKGTKFRRVTAGWSGIDFVSRDCISTRIEDGYDLGVGDDAESVRLGLRSAASEIPLEVSYDDLHKRTFWVAFPENMERRQINIDVREKTGPRVCVRSDSAFVLEWSKVIDPGSSYPGFEILFDRDMYIYENLGAIEKGICIDVKNPRPGSEGDGTSLRLSYIDDIATLKCGTCKIISYEPERVRLDACAERDCILLFQDGWYPGWRASVDGQATEILRTDVGLRAIQLPAGEHRVMMEYKPRSLLLGLGLTCIGILLTVGYAWAGYRRSRAGV
jgi:hypothetical protein